MTIVDDVEDERPCPLERVSSVCHVTVSEPTPTIVPTAPTASPYIPAFAPAPCLLGNLPPIVVAKSKRASPCNSA